MAMSDEHKEALSRGRAEARAVKAYLKALDGKRPGRPVTKETLELRLKAAQQQITDAEDPLKKLEWTQRRLDLEKQLADLADQDDAKAIEADFVEHAASYSMRKGISYTAWRELGVPAAILRKAGVKETRRR